MRQKLFRFLRTLGCTIMLITVMPFSRQPVAAGANRQSARSIPAFSTMAAGEKTIIEVGAETFGLPLSRDAIASQYEKPSVILEKGDRIQFEVNVPVDGVYNISFEMAAGETLINRPEGQLLVDGVPPAPDAQYHVFPVFYQNSTNQFPLDRYGNEALIRQVRLTHWTKVALRDANFSQKYPIQLNLTRGEHRFEFQVTRESMYLGSIYLETYSPDLSYSQYLETHPTADSSGVLLTLEAEFPSYKNDTSIHPINSRSLDVTPYDTYRLLLNTLGGESWKLSGSAVYYEIDVPEAGMYYITLRAIQNFKNNFTVYRRITINGSVLFDELHEVPFNNSPTWENITLGGEIPYRIFLNKGKNLLGIEANESPYRPAIEKIQKVLIDINNLSLEIKKLTGNQVDRYKEWEITDYIPNIKDRLLAIAEDLRVDKEVLTSINKTGGSQEILAYQMAIDNILFLAEDPDTIPIYMNRFSQGSGSAAQLLGSVLPLLHAQPLGIDKIFIHSPDVTPPPPQVSFLTSFSEGIKRFARSFQPDPYQSIKAGEDELDVWVNRPRQYVDLLQTLTDQTFTPETGIKVKFSIMPNEQKLILANAASIQPDVALGVSTNQPYDLAVRNAIMDLRSFEDFDTFINIYTPGSLLSYIIDDSVYAIPETQDFWVTFYRRDILNSLGMPIPETWPDVIQLLPELQRYGMNYNTPLSSGSGTKPYLITAPYLFNFGAHLYSDDGFASGLAADEAIDAIEFMAESFTIYGMPLTTSNFYDSFRYGQIPIGISNVETYIKLQTAAPELIGLWEIDLYPATVLADGTQNRYATGSAQASIMFKATDKPHEAWEFMKWWMSTETQVDFGQQLLLNYGPEYLWFSANLEAFQHIPIPEEHKQVILEQWQWLQEPVKLPGGYMQERELSNAWNKIVFDGVNPRVAIDSSVVIINREITRKMEEFGYLKTGQRVKELKIPTIDTVRRWMENGR
ncbi:MAG TPA: extracellular solute-binding protein [Bellilinea sp.]|nr:extracellular solute-binding protein [Bellilinea sp.]